MIVATTTWTTTFGADASRIHYPNLDIKAASLPALVIFPVSRGRRSYASGAKGIPYGSLNVVIYAILDAGTLETNAEALLDELFAASTGLAIIDGLVSAASDPTEAARAAAAQASPPTAAYRSIQISLEHGLHA
jgi:hypothetical protein